MITLHSVVRGKINCVEIDYQINNNGKLIVSVWNGQNESVHFSIENTKILQ